MAKKEGGLRLWHLGVLLAALVLLSFMLGRYPVDPLTLGRVLAARLLPIQPDWPAQVETVVFGIRMPRVLLGALIGAGLSLAGAVYQCVFQNPLVSPDVLGASAGAGFGAALGLYLGAGYLGTTLCSFGMGIVAVGVVSLLASRLRFQTTLGLILGGIMVDALGTAALSYLKLTADPTNLLPAITYWLMGSLASARMRDVWWVLPMLVAGATPLLLWRWRLNVLSAGEEEARTMGVDARALRVWALLCATLITAACVSVSGMIGWIGLAIPHFARMLVGPDCRRLLPASMLLGSAFLLAVDNAARLIATSEIPIGILTAFVGAPFFFYLIWKEGRRG